MSRGATRSALGTVGAGLRELFSIRWIRIVLVLLVLALGARLALGFLLARAIDQLAAPRNLACVWEDLDLALFSGRGEVRFLSVAERGNDDGPSASARPPLLEIEYAVFDLELLALLRGELRIRRAEVDGLDALLERAPDGRWNLERHVDIAEVLALFEGEEPMEAEEDDGEESEAIDLTPPLAIGALRLQHARLHLIDAAVEPPFDATLEASVRLSSLLTSERPARFTVTLTGGDLLDGASLDVLASWQADHLHVELGAQAGALRPDRLAPYLTALDLRPASDTIETSLRAELDLEVIGELRDALRARVLVADMRLATDGTEAFALDELVFEVDSVSAERASLPRIEIGGFRGRAELEPMGALRVAGFDLLAAPPEARPTEEAPVPAPAEAGSASPAWADAVAGLIDFWAPGALPRWASLFARHDADAYPWSLEALVLRAGAFELVDRTVDPPAAFPLLVERIELAGIKHDPALPPEPVQLTASLRAPGVAETLELSGNVLPFAPQRRLDLRVAVDGIALGTADPYLAGAGLEPGLESGSFHLDLVGEADTDEGGRTEGWIEIREVAFQDSGELFGVRKIAASELVADPETRLLRLGNVELEGPRLAFSRDPSNAFMAFGLRTVGRAALSPQDSPTLPTEAETEREETPVPVAEAPEQTPEPAAHEPDDPSATTDEPQVSAAAPTSARAEPRALRLELGRLAWTDSRIEFEDRSTDPPTLIALEELGFELLDLTLGGDPGGAIPEPARLTARLRAGDIAEELVLEGSIRSLPGPVDLTAELALRGKGLRGGAATPYFRELGIEPVLVDGRAALDLLATIQESSAGWRVNVTLENGELTDGEERLAGMERLVVRDLLLGEEHIEMSELRVVRPFARLQRDAEGGLRAFGLRLGAPAVEGEAAEGAAERKPDTDTPRPLTDPTPLELPGLPDVRIERLAVEGASLTLADATLAPALETELRLDAEFTGLRTDGSRIPYELSLSIPETLERFAARGGLVLGPEELGFDAALEADGLRAGPFEGLLPPGLELETADGRFSGAVNAALRSVPEGGLGADFEVRELRWGKPDAEPWFVCGSFRAEALRIDPVAEVIDLGGVHTRNVELAARRDAQGALHVMGLRFQPGVVEEPPAAPPQTSVEAPEEEPAPARDLRLPRISFGDDVAVALDRLRFHDETQGPDARPLEARLAFRLEGPCAIVDAEPAELPPLAWRVEGAVEGLVESWALDGRVAPFATEPRLEATFVADGVRTQGLVEMLPSLAPLMSGEVEAGRLEGEFDGTFFVRRTRPNELGFARGFGAELQARELYYRDRPEGTVLAGVDEVRAEVKRVDPSKGLVHVDTIEVRTPRARFLRRENQVHALGFALNLVPETAPGVSPEVQSPEDSEPAVAAEASAAERAEPTTAEPSSSEFRVDRLMVSGIDVELVDESGEPALRVPLTGLDLEVNRFTTRAFREKKPVHFNAFLEAGPAQAVESSADTEPDPPVFVEASMAGRIALYPAPTGWTQAKLEGLELVSFAGVAATEDLVVQNGALDASLRVRLKGESGANVSTSLVFSDLSLEEPEGGLISETLSLPMALDTVLFLLRNPDGEHRINVSFHVDEEGVSIGALVLAATGAMAEVIAGAVAGAPLRLLTSIVPGSDEKPEPTLETLTLDFEPGSNELAHGDRERLVELGRRLASRSALQVRVRHELTTADVSRLSVLSNPSAADCLELVAGLRQRKAELVRRVDELVTETRTLLAVGAPAASDATLALRSHERELAVVEDDLDRVFGVLEADSQRQRDKRTRSAARTLGELRLVYATELLERALGRDHEKRLELRAPRFEVVDGGDAQTGGRVVIELRRR